VLRSVLLLVLGALLASIALVAYGAYRITAQGQLDERRQVDAIVVLGAAQLNGRPSDVFAARLRHAVELMDDGLGTYLVVTGGKLPDDVTTEAAVARSWAIRNGVPEAKILSEDRGRTTLESLEGVVAIMREHRLETALFVSDETHMLRVLRMASDLGIVAWGSPTRTSPTDQDPVRRQKSMLHELAGLAAYYAGGGRFFGDTATTSQP
jgi:uncharacterized SAM-binding protein YcdF (DUF218 family)